MMASAKYFSFLLVILFLNSSFVEIEARDPFNIMVVSQKYAGGKVGGFLDGLCLGAIKQSGPSPGQGNNYPYSQTLGGIKGGPSPGQGNKFTDSQTLGGIKGGPSPGQGNKFTDSQTLGGIK
ncbi:hypothetical protein SLEP1_g60157, partial [Rubroshorea leprosula]